MVEVGEPPSPVHVVFGYRKIKWTISNYFALRDVNDWTRSPVFRVYSPFLTEWELGLKHYRGRENMVNVYIKRVDNDPRYVRANWKFLFPRDEHSEKKFERDVFFQAADALYSIIHLFSKFEESILERSQRFTVKCHIIVYRNDDTNALEYYRGGCLKSLSQDLAMLGIFYRDEADTTLCFDSGETIDVHGTFLSCRNEVLKNTINGGARVNLNFPSEYIKGLEKLILFFYSGNIKHVLRVPSFATLKAIDDFNVEELREYFTSDEMSIETGFRVTELQFKWTVYNVNRMTRGCIVGHRMKGLGGEVFRLILFPRGASGTEDYMSAKIEVLSGEKPGNLCVFFGVYDICNVVRGVKRWRWSPYEDGGIMLNNAILADRKDILNNVFFETKGKIEFFCKFQKYTPVFFRPDEGFPIINEINKYRHFQKLSEDMIYLYTRCAHGDLLVFTRSSRIVHRVHKIVLRCRSYRLFTSLETRDRISIKDVEPEVVDITFRYIYTGIVRERDPLTLLQVFKFGDRLKIPALRNACARILEVSLNVENVSLILIAANDLKERGLESACFRFIRSNINAVKANEHWTTLMVCHPGLHYSLIQFVSSASDRRSELEDMEIDQLV